MALLSSRAYAQNPLDAPLPKGRVSITVEAGERQPFLGLGAGVNYGTYVHYNQLTPERQQKVNDLMWRDTGFNTVRLWWPSDRYAPDAKTRDVAAGFTTPFLTLAREAQKRGVTQLLLSPDVPKYLVAQLPYTKKDGTQSTRKQLPMERVAQYTSVLAQYLKDVQDTHGITFAATSLQNEPNTLNRAYFSPETMVEAVKALRRELDARGLESVKIIAPETSNVDGTAYQMVDALRADPTAWRAMAGIAAHSYHMAATETMAKKIESEEPDRSPLGTNSKEYWQTETSTPGREDAGNAYNAAVAASTFLNDMNHRVTHWVYFIGALESDTKRQDNGTRIMRYDAGKTGGDWLTMHAKYFYLKQLGQAFDTGAMFRKSLSSLESNMTWTYGRKPRIVVAAAKNPDGSWGVGISNFTSTATVQSWAWTPAYLATNAPYPTQPFEVTVKVAELSDAGEMQFAVHRSGPNGEKLLENAEQQAVTMKNGVVTLSVDPLQLVTLRSR